VDVDEVSTRPVVTVRSRIHIFGSATSPQFLRPALVHERFHLHASTVITSLLPLSCDYQRSLQLRFRPFVRARTGWRLLYPMNGWGQSADAVRGGSSSARSCRAARAASQNTSTSGHTAGSENTPRLMRPMYESAATPSPDSRPMGRWGTPRRRRRALRQV
jgi:hypothetical protein